MILNAFSKDFLLIKQTNNGKEAGFEEFRCFGNMSAVQLNGLTKGIVISGEYNYY